MGYGICIFAESYNDILDPIVGELVSAALIVKKVTREPVKAILIAKNCTQLIKQLEAFDIDEIYTVETDADCLLKDDVSSNIISEMLKRINPSSILIPASVCGRSIFSRVAAKMNTGLTADCTELIVDKNKSGNFYIKQNKPSYGENIMVSIITRENNYPQMITIRAGAYKPNIKTSNKIAKVYYFEDITVPKSKVKIISKDLSSSKADSIMSAEIVVVGGRGVLEEETFKLLQKFATEIDATIGGTRPLADAEIIPFENQIGQTGFTIRPKICISMGVSGAIQHTEGIKDVKLYIAINSDKEASIFNFAHYGIVANAKEVLNSILEIGSNNV